MSDLDLSSMLTPEKITSKRDFLADILSALPPPRKITDRGKPLPKCFIDNFEMLVWRKDKFFSEFGGNRTELY